MEPAEWRFRDLGAVQPPCEVIALHATAHTSVASALTTTRLSWEPLTDGPGFFSSFPFFLLHDAPGGLGSSTGGPDIVVLWSPAIKTSRLL